MKTKFKIGIGLVIVALIIGMWIYINSQTQTRVIIDTGHVFCMSNKEYVDYYLQHNNCTYSLQDISPKPLSEIVSEEFGTKIPTSIPNEIKDSVIIKRVKNANCENPVHQRNLMKGLYVDESGRTILCIFSFP